jgi:hypothetical protein
LSFSCRYLKNIFNGTWNTYECLKIAWYEQTDLRNNRLDLSESLFYMPDDMKNCPNCGKEIKAKARICRYCRAELPEMSTPAPEVSSSSDGKTRSGGPRTTCTYCGAALDAKAVMCPSCQHMLAPMQTANYPSPAASRRSTKIPMIMALSAFVAFVILGVFGVFFYVTFWMTIDFQPTAIVHQSYSYAIEGDYGKANGNCIDNTKVDFAKEVLKDPNNPSSPRAVSVKLVNAYTYDDLNSQGQHIYYATVNYDVLYTDGTPVKKNAHLIQSTSGNYQISYIVPGGYYRPDSSYQKNVVEWVCGDMVDCDAQ